jgi:hypothetical protein
LFGWIPPDPAKPSKQTWGGHLAIPREVYARPDGKLGTRLPSKFVKHLEKLPWQPNAGEWHRGVAELNIKMPEGMNETRLSIAPLGEVVFTRERIRILDSSGECWSELPADLNMTDPFIVTVFVDGGIVEVFVAQRHSVAARLPAKAGPVKFAPMPATVTSMRFSEWPAPANVPQAGR